MLNKFILIFAVLFSKSVSSQTTYTFNGNGNWSDTLNWLNQSVPPLVLPKGDTIIISPVTNGQCVLNVFQTIENGHMTILPNKKFKVNGNLNLNWKELNPNVHVIDSAKLTLISDSAMLSQGIYKFTSPDTIPSISTDDFIIGVVNSGYTRKVTGVSYTNTPTSPNSLFTVTLNTIQAAIEDIFKSGQFEFNLPVDNSMQGGAGNALVYNFPLDTLYHNGALSIVLNNGSITLNPNWHFDFNFLNSTLKHFEIACQNATLNSNFQIDFNATQAITLVNESVNLKHFSKTFTKWVPVAYGIPVPIVVVMDIDLICNYSADVSGSISKSLVFNSANSLNLGVKYDNSQWQPIYNFNHSNDISTLPTTGDAHSTINVSIGPKISFKLYGLVGPYLSVDLTAQGIGNIASPSLDWDFTAEAWLKTVLGINATILGNTLFNYNNEWNTSHISYNTPDSIKKVSGDNQTGSSNQYLNQPLVIRVINSEGNPQSNVPVYFNVTNGGGILQNNSMLSDANGYAQNTWQLGSLSNLQTVEVSVKKANGTNVQNSPIVFSAQTTDSTSLLICGKRWMTKNLDVVTYRNGDTIPQVSDSATWANLTTGAWCYYNNDSSNGAIYGKLYNSKAISDPRGLAPLGWHISTAADWFNLANCFGGLSVAGGPLKSTQLWNSPNTGATNSSGFTGLPGGIRSRTKFQGLGNFGHWWAGSSPIRVLEYNSTEIGTLEPVSGSGRSVRCVKD